MYASADGKDSDVTAAAVPPLPMTTEYWYDSKNIAATTGPTALPIILMSMVMPRDMPLFCLGVDSMTTFMAPTFVSDIPMARTARLVDIESPVECKK